MLFILSLNWSYSFSEWIDIVTPGTDMIIEVEEQMIVEEMIVVEEEVIAGNAQEETVWVGETVAQERTAGVTVAWGQTATWERRAGESTESEETVEEGEEVGVEEGVEVGMKEPGIPTVLVEIETIGTDFGQQLMHFAKYCFEN